MRTFGLTHIGLAVKDTGRSLRYYHQVFGVEVSHRDAGTIQVTTPGCHDVIVFDKTAAHAGQSGGLGHFGFRLVSAADIDLAVTEVQPRISLCVRRRPGWLRNRDLV